MTSQTYHTDDHQLVQEHHPVVPDSDLMEPGADSAEADAEVAVAEPDLAEPDAESAAFTMPDYLGFTPAGDHDPAATATADSSNGSSSLVSVAYTVPESVTESQPAGNTASTHGPWNEIQAMFVDDPRASIERAAGLVDDRVEAHILSLREQQSSMRSPWQAGDAGTEELRVALQHYRTFWNGLEDLPE